MKHQHATIMFTDISGYSKMMSEDEENAIRLRKQTEKIIKELVPKNEGEIIQFYGDGALTMFSYSVNAIHCAQEIQKAIQVIPEIHLRIGVHAGNVLLESGNVYGETVNIASRIETFCPPGAVLFSQHVCEDIRNQPSLTYQMLGDFELKNIPGQMTLYALQHECLKLPSLEDLEGKGHRSQSRIAVLPFVNMSSDRENDYFSDGISEEILNILSKEDSLRVTARTSSFAYKGQNKDIREIGNQLNVDVVLEGSVRKAGDRVRITAQLINTSDGYHLLSETYDRTLVDIFAVQDEIALKISKKLHKTLGLSGYTGSKRKVQPTQNLEAYNDYLKGLFHWNKFEPIHVKKAITFLELAIEKDPLFAEAYSFLSFCFSFLGGIQQMPSEVAFPKALQAADQALAIDHGLVEAHCAKGLVHLFHEWDFISAQASFNRAKSINRQSDTFLITYGLFLKAAGQFVEAIDILEEAVSIDPVSIIANAYLADAYMNNHEFEKSLHQVDHLLDLFPGYPYGILIKGWTLYHQGNLENALSIASEKALPDNPFFSEFVALRGFLNARLGDEEKATKCLNRLHKLEEDRPGGHFLYQKCLVYYALDNIQEVKHLFNKSLEQPKGGMIMAYHDPFFGKILKDPLLSDEFDLFKSKIKEQE